jgi:hypothetical protein
MLMSDPSGGKKWSTDISQIVRLELELISKPFPLALAAANIGVTPITIHAASTDCILFEIKDFWVRHPVKDLAQGA